MSWAMVVSAKTVAQILAPMEWEWEGEGVVLSGTGASDLIVGQIFRNALIRWMGWDMVVVAMASQRLPSDVMWTMNIEHCIAFVHLLLLEYRYRMLLLFDMHWWQSHEVWNTIRIVCLVTIKCVESFAVQGLSVCPFRLSMTHPTLSHGQS